LVSDFKSSFLLKGLESSMRWY